MSDPPAGKDDDNVDYTISIVVVLALEEMARIDLLGKHDAGGTDAGGKQQGNG